MTRRTKAELFESIRNEHAFGETWGIQSLARKFGAPAAGAESVGERDAAGAQTAGADPAGAGPVKEFIIV